MEHPPKFKKKDKSIRDLDKANHFKETSDLPIQERHLLKAFTKAVSECFPKSSMYLCSVHILRCFMKNFKGKVDTTFFKNPGLVKIWRILSGSIFLPLGQTEILNVLKLYLKNESKTFPKNLARKFRKFLKYLNKFYFSDNAPFSPGFYPYFDLITVTGNFPL